MSALRLIFALLLAGAGLLGLLMSTCGALVYFSARGDPQGLGAIALVALLVGAAILIGVVLGFRALARRSGTGARLTNEPPPATVKIAISLVLLALLLGAAEVSLSSRSVHTRQPLDLVLLIIYALVYAVPALLLYATWQARNWARVILVGLLALSVLTQLLTLYGLLARHLPTTPHARVLSALLEMLLQAGACWLLIHPITRRWIGESEEG